MRVDCVTVDVATAGTEVRLSTLAGFNAIDKILWIRAKARPGNAGTNCFIGISDVASTNGWTLGKTDTAGLTLPFRDYGGSVPAADIYFDSDTNGDDIDVVVIME